MDELKQQPNKNWFLNHKFLWSLIGVLLLIVIAGSVYWWQVQKETAENLAKGSIYHVTDSATANWKTYTNDQYGFEFKYPSSLEIQESKTDQGEPQWRIGTKGIIDDSWLLFDFDILQANKQDLATFIKNYFGDPRNIIKQESLYSGMHVHFDGLPGHAYFQLANIGQVIKFETDKIDMHSQEFSQILSTFKFTDTNAKIDTSTWKTYTNNQYGFQFKYPDGSTISTFEPSINPSMTITAKNFRGALYDDHVDIYVHHKSAFFKDKNSTLESWLRENSEDPNVKETYSDYELDNHKGYEVYWPGISIQEDIMLENNDKIFDIGIQDAEDQPSVDFLEQILSTFKFTK